MIKKIVFLAMEAVVLFLVFVLNLVLILGGCCRGEGWVGGNGEMGMTGIYKVKSIKDL